MDEASANHCFHHKGYPLYSRGSAAYCPHDWHSIKNTLRLSAREVELVQGIVDDKVEFAMATDMGNSVNTVRTQLHRLRVKLQVSSRVQLVLRLVEEFQRMIEDNPTYRNECKLRRNANCPLKPEVEERPAEETRLPSQASAEP